MHGQIIRTLIIEDNPGDERLLREALRFPPGGDAAPRFEIACADALGPGLELLAAGGFDIVLLDLFLPDSRGLETLARICSESSEAPVIVLTGLADEALAVRAVQEGAQDYLVKGQIDGNLLSRAIRYAIERQRLQAAARSLSLVDELTGLYNRRGFTTLAERHLQLAARGKRPAFLLFADLDGLKAINDGHGHRAGDGALVAAAQALQRTFRATDVLGRIGGDEFTVLAVDALEESPELALGRLAENIERFNRSSIAPWKLALSAGVARAPAEGPTPTLAELMSAADALLYERKKARRTA